MKTIDMSLLPPPAFVKTPLFSDVKSSLLSELQILYPQFNALLESDPAVKLLEIVAYREIIITARVNQGMLAVLLAFAKGSDLDQIGANFDCLRLLITPANPDAIPPTEGFTRVTTSIVIAYSYHGTRGILPAVRTPITISRCRVIPTFCQLRRTARR
ncbi:hypothetical protein AB2E85_07395 [Escherichia coli]